MMDAEFVKQPGNIEKILKVISEDVASKRHPFSKNAKLILKTFKEKLGDDEFKSVAKEALGSEEEVQKIMKAFLIKKGKDSSKGFREFLKKKKSVKQKKDQNALDVFVTDS